MEERKPLTDEEGEVRELTAEDLKRFRPAADVLTTTLKARLAIRKRGARISPSHQRASHDPPVVAGG